jgi:poly(hydroxyalkanoate) depolymerase family esterase
MPGLGETVARLSRARLEGLSAGGEDAGLREVRGFGFNPGALRMLAYVPEGLAPGAGLVVVLHGCTQRAGAYARSAGWVSLADRLGFALLAPKQDCRNNPNRCFNWFEPDDTTRGSGEAASIHAMVQHMVRAYAVDPARVFVTGLSAGGAMTAVLLATYPETFAAGAVVAGLPFGVAANMQEAFTAMRSGSALSGDALAARVLGAAPAALRRPRLTIWHGEADRTVAGDNAVALARQWSALHGKAEEPDETLRRAGWTRSVWRGADGEVLLEMNLLAGLGHGAPIAGKGDDPIGEAAPFVLEAGVSSSLEIARFWGLAPPAALSDDAGWSPSNAANAAPRAGESSQSSLGESVMASLSHVSEDVQEVIAKALAAAGLMR